MTGCNDTPPSELLCFFVGQVVVVPLAVSWMLLKGLLSSPHPEHRRQMSNRIRRRTSRLVAVVHQSRRRREPDPTSQSRPIPQQVDADSLVPSTNHRTLFVSLGHCETGLTHHTQTHTLVLVHDVREDFACGSYTDSLLVPQLVQSALHAEVCFPRRQS